jgi:hypothetical protein
MGSWKLEVGSQQFLAGGGGEVGSVAEGVDAVGLGGEDFAVLVAGNFDGGTSLAEVAEGDEAFEAIGQAILTLDGDMKAEDAFVVREYGAVGDLLAELVEFEFEVEGLAAVAHEVAVERPDEAGEGGGGDEGCDEHGFLVFGLVGEEFGFEFADGFAKVVDAAGAPSPLAGFELEGSVEDAEVVG